REKVLLPLQLVQDITVEHAARSHVIKPVPHSSNCGSNAGVALQCGDQVSDCLKHIVSRGGKHLIARQVYLYPVPVSDGHAIRASVAVIANARGNGRISDKRLDVRCTREYVPAFVRNICQAK